MPKHEVKVDPYLNPFAPGAGSRPPELAGRDSILEQARISCGRAVRGKHARSLMLLGLRGTGKTVLLNEIEKIGKEEGLLTSKIESPEDASLARLLVPEMRKVMRSLSVVEASKSLAGRGLRGLRGFASIFRIEVAGFEIGIDPEPGLADSGDLEFDLPDLFVAIGEAAQAAGKGWLLLIDEVQYLSEKDLSALIVSMHRVSQSGLPVLFMGAAVRRPIEEEGAAIADSALNEIVVRTQGYPFFLQEWASITWNNVEGPEITLSDVQQTYKEAIVTLDEGFFKVRIDRLTKAEVQFVKAMAASVDGPYPMADIAAAMGRTLSSLGPARASIIKKGMIYSTDHGYLDFTVPLFAEFMRRQGS